jgi:hypothetical protein
MKKAEPAKGKTQPQQRGVYPMSVNLAVYYI